jgi:hypothetical protein
MNPTARAHRILVPLKNYKKAEPTDDFFLRLSEARLGEPLGCYQNETTSIGNIGVFTEGLSWLDGDNLIVVRYENISEVTLPGDKSSRSLLLKKNDGHSIWLPITGGNEKFFDSLEMLRFLDRVTGEIRKSWNL